jgi:septum formation protein
MPRLVLASQSPRRADLLTQAGLPFEVRATGVDERAHEGEGAVEHARRIALAKVQAAAAELDDDLAAIVLAADTVVWQPPDGPPLGKPESRSHAAMLLRSLGGDEPHLVTTAWALSRQGQIEVHHETTRVWMRTVDPDELDAYLDTEEWRDKAGGYGIQGRAGAFVVRIDGSYTNVVGLPLSQVVVRLHALVREGGRR